MNCNTTHYRANSSSVPGDPTAKTKAAPGHEVYALTPEQLAAWKTATAPLEQRWTEAVRKTGQDPDRIMADLRDNIAKYGAGL